MLMISGNKLKKDAVYCQDGIKFGFDSPAHPQLINTDKITDWRQMFYISSIYGVGYPGGPSIGNIPLLDISNGEDFNIAGFGLFEDLIQPNFLKQFPKATNLGNAFEKCKYENFTITALLAENIQGLLNNAYNLKTAVINTPKAKKAFQLCFADRNLLTVNLTTDFLEDAKNMFSFCSQLKSVFGKIKLSETTTIGNSSSGIFDGCTDLEDIEIEGTIGSEISLSDSALLSDASILSICQALKDGIFGTPTVTFNTALAAKATDSVKLDSGVLVFCDSADPDALGTLQQYVTAKGWILAFA